MGEHQREIVRAVFGDVISQPGVGGSDGVHAVIFPKGVVGWTIEDVYAWSGVTLEWAIDKVELDVVGKSGAECGCSGD